MTQEVAKVTHQEAVLASSAIKWKENIIMNRWGLGSSGQSYIIKVLQKKALQLHEIISKQKRN
jgi:hypothetical protein